MSIGVIQNALDATTSGISATIPWDQIEQALVISFTYRNKGDLHIDVRQKQGFNPTSHKTHIDLTSGGDLLDGLSPVTDFCAPDQQSRTYRAFINTQNIADLNGVSTSKSLWIEDKIQVTLLNPRNDAKNPSAQFLKKDDINELRTSLRIGDSCIFLKKKDDTLLALGARTTPELAHAMQGKTKRMFCSNLKTEVEKSNLDTDIPSLDKKIESDLGLSSVTRVNSGSSQGWLQDPEKQKAIEDYAMQVVWQAFEARGFLVKDVHTTVSAIAAGLAPYPGYDLLANKIGIEVKGSTTSANSIIITANELISACINKNCLIAVVSDIKIAESKPYCGSGGRLKIFRWADIDALVGILDNLKLSLSHASSSGLKLTLSSLKWTLDLEEQLVKEVNIEDL